VACRPISRRPRPIHTSNIPSTKSHIHFLSLRSFIQGIHPGLRLLVVFHNKHIFYGEEMLAPRPTPKLQDHPLSAVCDCLFNIFAATLHIWRPSPPSATCGCAMPWWQGTHLTCYYIPLESKHSQHSALKHPQSIFFSYVRDKVSHPYRTTGKIILLYIFICMFLGSR
jgi:hypothetical protein